MINNPSRRLCILLAAIAVEAIAMVCQVYAQTEANPPGSSESTANAVRHIKVATAQTVIGVQTFDEQTSVEVSGDARFIRGADGKLVFKRQLKAPPRQIFQGFSPGEVIFDADSVVLPEWWGGSGSDDPSFATANVAAINAALAAVANCPLAVSLNGLYYVDGKLCPRSGTRLIAAERGIIKAVANWAPTAGNCLIEIDGQPNVTIDGIEIDGNRINQTQDAEHTCRGILVKDSPRCTIKNCTIHDCNGPTAGGACGNGIITQLTADALISENRIHSNNGCGINLNFASSKIRVVNNTIWNNTEIGIESEGRNGIDYTNFRNSDIVISGNDITGKAEADRLDDHSILVDWTDGAVVSANKCKNNNHNGIEILGSRKVDVLENECANNGDPGPQYIWAGIRVTAEGFGEDGRSYDVTIRGNRITRSQYGIYIDTATRVLVSVNRITDVVNSALTIGAGTAEVVVSDGS